MLKQRLVAAALGLPMLFVLLWLNWFLRLRGIPDNLPLLAVVLLIAGASGWEVSCIVRRRYPKTAPVNGVYAAVLLPLLVHGIRMAGAGHNMITVSSVGLLIDSLGTTAATMLLFLAVWSDIEQRGREGIMENLYVLLGGAYLGVTLSCLLLIELIPFHEIAVGLVFLLVFTLDTAAYFGGKHFGGLLLAPRISPRKTLAGALCGMIATLVLTLGVKYVPHVAGFSLPELPWWNLGAHLRWEQLLLLGVGVGILGQVGDLVESAFKRWGDVKDSGVIIPGHGGFLDRFDSLLLVAPYCYLLLTRVLNLPL